MKVKKIIDPTIDPIINPMNPLTNPLRFNPKFNPKFNPTFNPTINPMNPPMNPLMNNSVFILFFNICVAIIFIKYININLNNYCIKKIQFFIIIYINYYKNN
jgi:hypothetical protein